jgi:carbamate kinase
MNPESSLIAIGGNAIVQPREEGNLDQQYNNTRSTMKEIAEFVERYQSRLILSHGNGPQVGNIIFRSEIASKEIYPLSLDVCVSDSEGGMGYMIQQILHNQLAKRNIQRDVVTIITQTEVSSNDPAFQNPTKFIGRPYTPEEAEIKIRERGWIMKEDVGRGLRRVVPSPTPLRIIEASIVRTMLQDEIIVIAAGGGGIPVEESSDGCLFGIDAVVDKDLASALLASNCNIDTFIILTGTDYVYVNFQKPDRKALTRISAHEAQRFLDQGEFPAGSMGPKIQAAVNFLRSGGKRVVITSPGNLLSSLQGEVGTHILP